MTTMRQTFTFASSATVTDTGPPMFGRLLQTRWEQTGTGDTGADLAIYAQQREADTGDGILVVNDNDCLGVDFFRQYRMPMHATDGGQLDTGADLSDAVVMAGDRLRVRITPAGGTVSGRLYVWTKD